LEGDADRCRVQLMRIADSLIDQWSSGEEADLENKPLVQVYVAALLKAEVIAAAITTTEDSDPS